ncbi:MAG: PHP domain-containing protein [Endomicrobium sp.]|jgi:predicted metal-dependent phosphoesterase TrpH|nr:PHP domain-containing protein [Endomicrobium sp.]
MSDIYVDLHIHTNYSDGVFTPSQAADYAAQMKLAAISITDHDSVDGIDEAVAAAKDKGVEVISGIELSCVTGEELKDEIHILGYFIDYKSQKFKNVLEEFKEARRQRARQIYEKLKAANVVLKNTDFFENAKGKSIGRMHFAKALVEEKFVGGIQEAFQRYLSRDKPAYAPKKNLTASDGIKLILENGGIPVMAHPYYTHYSDRNMKLSLIKDGLMGIEAWHSKHPESAVKKFLSMAQEYGLIATGGSDCHGPFKNERPIMGRVRVPYSVVENLAKAKEKLIKS